MYFKNNWAFLRVTSIDTKRTVSEIKAKVYELGKHWQQKLRKKKWLRPSQLTSSSVPIGTEDVSRHDTTVRYVYRGAEFLLETSTYSNALNVGASKFVDVSMETQYRDTSSAQ